MAVSHVYSAAVGNWTGTVTVFNSQGSTTTVAATALVRPQDWNSVHNQFYTLFGNTSLSSTASGTNVQFGVSGPYLTIIGSSDSVVISSPKHISSYENLSPNAVGNLIAATNNTSICVAFNLPYALSASFLRVGARMTTQSTSLATTAASLSASVEIYSTINAVIYSMGTGASSKSLISVASGSNAWTMRNSISVAANGTQYSQSWQHSWNFEGTTSSFSTSTARSTSTYNISNPYTDFSGSRMVDVQFANSLPAGAYWLVYGVSSTSSTGASTGFSAASQCYARLSDVLVKEQQNTFNALLGQTNLTSGGLMGAGMFSTAGGGTTSAFDISAISSTVSNQRLYFQLLRSA